MDLSEVVRLEELQQDPHRLSRLMREGAKLHPQAWMTQYDGWGTCAYGAVAAGLGFDWDVRGKGKANLPDLWYEVRLGKHYIAAAETALVKRTGYVMTWLNDVHRWTRERIADELEAAGF